MLTRTDVPAARLLNGLLLIPFYVSPLVLAFAWAIVYGPSGFVTLWVASAGHLHTNPKEEINAHVLDFIKLYCILNTSASSGSVRGSKPPTRRERLTLRSRNGWR